MNLCPKVLPPRRVFAFLCIFAVAFLVRAERIQFSKPAVPLAAPAKAKDKPSGDRSKGFDLDGQGFERPMISQPQIIRVRPRETEEEDGRSDPSEPRDPREGTDPADKSTRKDKNTSLATRQKTAPKQPWLSEKLGAKRPDGSRALSPVTDFNWDARESGNRPSDPVVANRSSTTDRSDTSSRSPLATRRDSDQQNENVRPLSFFDVAARPKEQPTREVLEGRAAFEKMLSPNTGIAAKTPGSFEPITSLDPVTSFDPSKPALPLKVPTIGSGKVEARPGEPIQPFSAEQARLRGPVIEDINKKSSAKPAPAPGPSAEPNRQTPLNRQPSVHEFPARKF